MSEYNVAIKIAGQLDNSFKNAIKGAQSGLSGLGVSGKIGSLAVKGIGVVAKATAAAMTAAAGSAVALGSAAIKVGMEFESAFAGVKKTVDASDAQLEQLKEGILDMSTRMPTAATDIAAVAEAAGQLGIQTDSILSFTETMVMLGDATNMTADEAATQFARFANIVGMPQSEFGRLGSTVVALGNNLATTESEITAMAMRLAGAGSQIGLSESQIMAFSGALSSVGIEAEAGGSAFSKLMINMQLATETGGESLSDFANVAGMSASDFATAFKTDASGAITSFIRGLANAEASGKSAIGILDDMGIKEVRLRDTLLRAAGASELMSDALNIANDAWNQNNALTNEAEQRYATMESRISILKNQVKALGIAFYEDANGPIGQAVSIISDSIGNLTAAYKEGGLSGMFAQLGTEAANGIKAIADNAPAFIDAAATMIDNLVTGIDQNADGIGASLGRLITSIGAAIIKLAPRIAVGGMHLLVAIGKGIVDNLDVLKAAALEAAQYFWTAIKEAFKSFKDFLTDDEVEPFKKVIALIPLIVAGFAIFDGIAGSIKGFVTSFKNGGKGVASAAQGFTKSGNTLSKAAKNFLAFGAAIAMAAGGIWILTDAAIRISQAGPEAGIALGLMVAGLAALMIIAGVFGKKMNESATGLLAFGGAILMASGGMMLMALAATMLAQAGPMALGGLAIMVGGMIALLAVAGALGTQLATATPGLLAFGGAILMAAAGMMVMALAATMVAGAGTGAIITLGLMVVGLAGLMAIAALLGPALSAAAIGLIAFGAAILLASVGMWILSDAAINIAEAGPAAGIGLALLMAAMLAFGAVAGLLSPILLLGAAAIAALGGAFMLVAGAALMGAQALQMTTNVLPQLATIGQAGAAALLTLGAALTAFAGGAALAGAGAGAAALGFGALALTAAAAVLAFTPLALALLTAANSILVIAGSASTAVAGLTLLMNFGRSIGDSMNQLAQAFPPAAAAMVPFAAAVMAVVAATGSFAASLLSVNGGMALLVVGITAAAMGLLSINTSIALFIAQAVILGNASITAAAAFIALGNNSGTVASQLLGLVAPMTSAGAAAAAMAAGMAGAMGTFMAMAATLMALTGSVGILAAAIAAVGAALGMAGNAANVASMGFIIAQASLISFHNASQVIIQAAALIVAAFTAIAGGVAPASAALLSGTGPMSQLAASAVAMGLALAASVLLIMAYSTTMTGAALATGMTALAMAALSAASSGAVNSLTILQAISAAVGPALLMAIPGIQQLTSALMLIIAPSTSAAASIGMLVLAMTGLTASVVAAGLAIMGEVAAVGLLLAMFVAVNLAMAGFRTQSIMVGASAAITAQAFRMLLEGSRDVPAFLSRLVAPMTLAGTAALTLSMGASTAANSMAQLMVIVALVSQSVLSATVSFMAFNNTVSASMNAATARVIASLMLMIASFRNAQTQILATVIMIAAGIKAAFDIDLESSGVNMMRGLIDGMNSMKASVMQTATEIATAAATAVNTALKINSPSKVLTQSGEFTGAGFANGLENSVSSVKVAAASLTAPVIDQSEGMRTYSLNTLQGNSDSLVSETLGNLTSGSSITNNNTTQTSSPVFNYNPNITIQGNANQSDIEQALSIKQSDFDRMASEWVRNNGRMAFA